jgi:tetratricopeptide (TPR) repeat protein
MRASASLLAFALLAAGCATPVNVRKAAGYAGSCAVLEAQNAWRQAQRACGRAAADADLGAASDAIRAALWYEYGRASGAVCDYGEAQRGLDIALHLDEKSGGPVFKSLLELGRLHLAQHRYSQAVEYFARFEQAVPKGRAETEDPDGYAEALDDYALAAEHAGHSDAANVFRARAAKLRKPHPGAAPARSDRTPYGQYCNRRS